MNFDMYSFVNVMPNVASVICVVLLLRNFLKIIV